MKLYSLNFRLTSALREDILGKRELAFWFFSLIVLVNVSNDVINFSKQLFDSGIL